MRPSATFWSKFQWPEARIASMPRWRAPLWPSLSARVGAEVELAASNRDCIAMKREIFVLAALLADCAPESPPAASVYRALGTEPFWNLSINALDMTFTGPDTQKVRERTPKKIIGIAGEIYRSPRIDV